ncbi:MAG: GGDEF domain-containing protein [Oscillospiraceae bacterium]|nr:GGDEF domain-containing protein [Oscillospiraceae bacterium]
MADLHFDDTHITHMIEILSFIFNMGLITAASALLIKALVIAFKEERRTSVNLLKELENLSVKDQITGLYNRRYMLSYLEDAIDDMHHENKPLSIIMFDIDKFKDKNDTHGHMTGDEILKNVACAIVENCRRSDIAARYGGDEFVVIMPGVSGTAAYISANRIREYIETKNIVPDIDIRITISGGVVSYEDDLNVAVLLEMADDNLYKAKNRGQNMIVWEQVYPISKYTGIHQ